MAIRPPGAIGTRDGVPRVTETLRTNHGAIWSIVLAGGEGKRMSTLIRRWLGEPRPKQFCTFLGTRSLLEHTLDRADKLNGRHGKLVVITRTHTLEAWNQLTARPSWKVILQPADRDTAPGIFLPLTYVRASDPNATVVVYPSDHFIYPEGQFLDVMRRALEASELLPERLIVLGAWPHSLDSEHELILPGGELHRDGDYAVKEGRSFFGNGDLAKAEQVIESGGLWNTLVLVARVETLWKLGWSFLPEIMPLFERLEAAIGSESEALVLESTYRQMP